MTKDVILAQLINRKSVIENRGKSTPGVLKKLERQIRNLKKELGM